jgi:lysophospholipid acyltransferase (LPLAT)-like uncharacterized protein
MAEKISDLSFRKKIEYYLAVWFGWIFIVLLCKTYRMKYQGREILQRLIQQKQPFLISIWHGRFFVAVYFFRFWRLTALVSQHLDGEMIARTLYKLGFFTVRGSSTRGGKEAFHEMVELLRNGKNGVIIPDGPKGPRHQLKLGVIYMASQANVPIVPFTFSAKPAIRLNSWDHYMVPKPFARVLINIGEPIWVADTSTKQKIAESKKVVESVMIKQEKQTDAFFTP